jgi:general secretion pathway protein F
VALFEYRGLNSRGKRVSGRIDGSGRRSVLHKLQEQQIYPTELYETVADQADQALKKFTLRRKVAAAELSAVTRQMATLLSAGLPLDEVLQTVAGQSGQDVLSDALSGIREEVMQGEALHKALASHERIFPDVFINMVQVGESSGTLDQVLHRLADFLDDQAKIQSKVKAALAYPVLMTVVGVGVLVFLFIFVVPKITGMLAEMEIALPLPTKMLMGLSAGLAAWWWLLLLGLVAAVLALTRYRRSEKGRLSTDQLMLKLPLYGKLHLLFATAWFSRTLATLLQSGVPLLRALDISSELLKNRVLKGAIEDVRKQVQEGGSMARALKDKGVFPPMLAQIAAAGERSGELENMLFRVADTYEHQTDMAITGLLSLLEPLLILVMGTVVGFVVLAILLPIFEASQGF